MIATFEGGLELLQGLANAPYNVHLFKARTGATLPEIVECDYTGYLTSTLTPDTLFRNALGNPAWKQAAENEFAPTDGLAPQDAIGFYITDGADLVLLFYEDFLTPVPMINEFSTLSLTPVFQDDLSNPDGYSNVEI